MVAGLLLLLQRVVSREEQTDGQSVERSVLVSLAVGLGDGDAQNPLIKVQSQQHKQHAEGRHDGHVAHGHARLVEQHSGRVVLALLVALRQGRVRGGHQILPTQTDNLVAKLKT